MGPSQVDIMPQQVSWYDATLANLHLWLEKGVVCLLTKNVRSASNLHCLYSYIKVPTRQISRHEPG